jgi:hypothetical protein
MKKLILLSGFFFFSLIICLSQTYEKHLIVKLTNIGNTHSSNIALEQIIKEEIPVSVSFSLVGQWITESVEIIKLKNNISAGIELTITSEWTKLKNRPLLGSTEVPDLVDEYGNFKNKLPKELPVSQCEKEFRAQINRAFAYGLKIEYLDVKNRSYLEDTELKKLLIRLSEEFNLTLAWNTGEIEIDSHERDSDPNSRLGALGMSLKRSVDGNIYVLSLSPGKNNDETKALNPVYSPGITVNESSEATTEMITSEEFIKLISRYKLDLITYHDLLKR